MEEDTLRISCNQIKLYTFTMFCSLERLHSLVVLGQGLPNKLKMMRRGFCHVYMHLNASLSLTHYNRQDYSRLYAHLNGDWEKQSKRRRLFHFAVLATTKPDSTVPL